MTSFEPELPVLTTLMELISTAQIPKLDKTVFVCVQHLLPTVVPLFQSLIILGVKPKNLFVIGKQYSTISQVSDTLKNMGLQVQPLSPLTEAGNYLSVFNQDVKRLWNCVESYISENFCERIVVLDDGGRCLELMPASLCEKLPIIGIEQTTAGTFNHNVFSSRLPFIDVATSAAKRILESKIIMAEILESIGWHLSEKKQSVPVFGVIGIGAIGKPVTQSLLKMGGVVWGYDANHMDFPDKVQRACAIKDLIKKSDYIFGCTGRDITSGVQLEDLHSDKTFISCSSEDKEFNSLLKQIKSHSSTQVEPLEDIRLCLKNKATVTLLKGGFPINFNRSFEFASPENIQLTRALLLGAIFQGIFQLSNPKTRASFGQIMLNPKLQHFVVKHWGSYAKHPKQPELSLFSIQEWIIQNSGGTRLNEILFDHCFEAREQTAEANF